MNGLAVPPLIHSSAGECKGCDPCGQLLSGMQQALSAVHTLHTLSMAAHRRSTGVYNKLVARQQLGQRFCYSLVQLIGLSYLMGIVWRYF